MSDLPDLPPELGQIPLADLLASIGVDQDEIDRAVAARRLELLAMAYFVLPPGERFDENEVAERVGSPVEVSRAYWRALGFPEPQPDEKVFTEDDVVMMRNVTAMLEAGNIGDDLSIEMTRVIGSSMARIAIAQVDVLEGELRKRIQEEEAEGGEVAQTIDPATALRTAQFLPVMPEIFAYVWRRHMAAGARARLALAEGDSTGGAQVVGFADLVGYTALSQQLTDEELASVVQRFEAIAHDTVTARGGRVVKLIGDGVMFAADDIENACEIALNLAERYREDEELSDVRVGLAWGPVLRRDGDLYGTTVNLASRIVNVAYPGTVLIGDRIKEWLEEDERYAIKKVRSHNLKDIGRTRLWALRRAEEPADDDAERALERARDGADDADREDRDSADPQRVARDKLEKLERIRAAEERRASRAALMDERRERRKARRAADDD